MLPDDPASFNALREAEGLAIPVAGFFGEEGPEPLAGAGALAG